MIEENSLQKGELKAISKILIKLQEKKNDGKGIECVREIAKHLKKGRIKEAISCARQESDKLLTYPEIRQFINDVIYPIGYLDPKTGLFVNDKE